jgi:hypothetical protein
VCVFGAEVWCHVCWHSLLAQRCAAVCCARHPLARQCTCARAAASCGAHLHTMSALGAWATTTHGHAHRWCACRCARQHPTFTHPTRPHHTGWQSWQWDSLAKMMHVVPHVGDPGSDASRVLVRWRASRVSRARACVCVFGVSMSVHMHHRACVALETGTSQDRHGSNTRRSARIAALQTSNQPTHQHATTPTHDHTNMPARQHATTPTHTNTPTHHHTTTRGLRCSAMASWCSSWCPCEGAGAARGAAAG